MFRTVPKGLASLFALIMSALFHSVQRRDWLREFAGVLALNAPLARRTRARDCQEAARTIAWSLGQLVQDPVLTSKEELTDRHERQSRNIKRRGDDEPIEHLIEDMNNTNILAFRLLVAFGVVEQVRAAFPAMQASSDPLFTEEAWPSWWQWADNHFFKQSPDAAPTLDERKV